MTLAGVAYGIKAFVSVTFLVLWITAAGDILRDNLSDIADELACSSVPDAERLASEAYDAGPSDIWSDTPSRETCAARGCCWRPPKKKYSVCV